MALLAGLPGVAADAGGVMSFLRRLTRWRGRMDTLERLTAAAHQRADAKSYRRWLSRTAAAHRPRTPIIAVVAVAGMPADRLPAYWRLALRHTAGAGMDVRFLADAPAAAALERLGQCPAQVDVAPAVDAAAMVAAARRHLAAAPGGRPRLVAFFGPGHLPTAPAYPPMTGAALCYGDEDCLDASQRPADPFFKPGYSPDLLMHMDYVSAGMAVTPALLERLPTPPPRDLHGLALALAERADRIERVAATVARRCHPTAAPPCGVPHPPSYLARFLHNRYGPDARVEAGTAGWTLRFGSPGGLVSVIVPTRDRLDLLAPCIDGIYASNDGDGYEVIIIDNGSTEAATGRWLAAAADRHERLRVLPAPGEFNWSRLNNLGFRAARGDSFVFLNNDTAPRRRNWLARLADVAGRPDTGFVGALLLYPSGRIQHAGLALGFGGCADHIYRGILPVDGGHMFVPPTAPRNVAAVTGACMAASRRTLEAVGLFDENYRVAGGDVEICIRAFRAGLLNVYLPDVALTHHESQSRSRTDPEADTAALKALVGRIGADPWYNPRLSLVSTYPSYPL